MKKSPTILAAAAWLWIACSADVVYSQTQLITEQGNVPALFEEVSAAIADTLLKNDPRSLQSDYYDRVRVVRVRSELLRREADYQESSPLYLNPFPDLGVRIYMHGRIKRQHGFDWLASPYPQYDGRTFVNLIDTSGAHRYSGMHAEMNLPDSRFEGVGIAPIYGSDFVAVTETRRVFRSDYPTAPQLKIYQSSALVLSEPQHSFLAEAGVRVDYSGLDAHFASEDVGYFITAGGEFHPQPSKLYKTTDGGRSWALINDAVPGTPYKIHFTDDNTGYLLDRQAGKSRLLKTTDGGKTWQGFDHSEFFGAPQILDVRIDDHLYAIVQRNSAGERPALAVSTDGAATWRDVYRFPTTDRLIHGAVVEGNILAGFHTGQLLVIDPATARADTITVPGRQLADFRAPSLGAIYVATQDQLMVTTDRGTTWRPIRDGWFRLIAAPGDKELVLIVNEGSSDSSDTATTSDVIAYSDDAGATWEETALIGGLISSSKRAQSLSSNVHKVMLHERVLTVLTSARD